MQILRALQKYFSPFTHNVFVEAKGAAFLAGMVIEGLTSKFAPTNPGLPLSPAG